MVPYDFFEIMKEDLTSKYVIPRFKEQEKVGGEEKVNLVGEDPEIQADKKWLIICLNIIWKSPKFK